MIVFDSTTWTISLPPGESVIGRQYDNMTRSITVTGVPDGWDWTLLVQASGKLDLIDLEPVEGGVGVTLTAQMLSLARFYTLQLRGTQGDLVRHTNVLQVLVPKSLSGSATWPTVPSAVEQVLQQLEELNQHPPYPGDGGYWMVWDLDAGAYVESQLPLPPVAEGPAGKDATITVGETITGQPGTPASVVNTGTESAAVLNFTIPQGQQGNPGAAATVEVGETVTGDPGTEASVENVGTSSAAVLRFTIPSGATGATPDISVEVTGLPGGSEPTVDVSGTPEAPVISLGIPAGQQGDPGNPGQTPNITIGTVETLPAGSDVTASITGQTPNLALNLGIPKGQQGDPGQAATVTVGTTTTGAPGSQASVINSGTESAAVLDFTLPAGETGAGVPPTDGVPDNYVLTPAGWAEPSGGGSTGELDTIADFTIEGEPVAEIVIDKDQTGQPFRYRKVYINIDVATAADLGNGTGNIWCYFGNNDEYRRIIYTIQSAYTVKRSLNGFAIGLDGAVIAAISNTFLNQSENDETNGIPYLKFQCTEPDKFQFQPGTVVRIHGEGRMK